MHFCALPLLYGAQIEAQIDVIEKKVRHREKENKREKYSHTNSSRDRDREVQSSGKSYIKLALTVAAMAL